MPDPAACKHQRTKLVAEDEFEKYFECLECGAIFESGELDEPPPLDESLSDA